MSEVWLTSSHFLQMETFRAKSEFCVFVIINQQIGVNADLKKILWLMHYQNWVTNIISFGK